MHWWSQIEQWCCLVAGVSEGRKNERYTVEIVEDVCCGRRRYLRSVLKISPNFANLGKFSDKRLLVCGGLVLSCIVANFL